MSAVLALLPASWAPYAKYVISLVGALLTAAVQVSDFLPENVQRWVSIAVGFATAAGVYGIRNEPPLELPHDHDEADAARSPFSTH